MSTRFIIRCRDPKSGTVLFLTQKKTLASRGRLMKFKTLDDAWRIGRNLLARYPHLRAFNLHAEEFNADIRKNPSGFEKARDSMLKDMDRKEDAARAFENFSGRRATKETTFKAPPFNTGFALGELVGVIYRANRVGDRSNTVYHHEFKKSSRPLLIAKHDGTQLGIVGGHFLVTEKGIEDR